MKLKVLDPNIWITQAALAKELKVTVQCVNNWIARDRIKYLKIPGSRLVLVDKTTAPDPKLKRV